MAKSTDRSAATNQKHGRLRRWLSGHLVGSVGVVVAALLTSGCTAPGLLLTAAGIATDHSMTLDIIKHVHAQLTDGDPLPCLRLNSVQRALNVRCAPFEPGSIRTADLARSGLQTCVLGLAVSEPRLWPAVPELIEKGANAAACETAPLVMLAQRPGGADLSTASPEMVAVLAGLALADPRSVNPDVMRLLSGPGAMAVGLDAPLATWLARGDLDLDKVSFAPLGALHPDALAGPFAEALELRGHTARQALGGIDGVQTRGFELALRTSQWAALEWWLARVPKLANRVPPTGRNALPWVPLARVLTAGFMTSPESRGDMVTFLIARGADPQQRLPHDPGMSVLQYARSLHSPEVARLDPPRLPVSPSTTTLADGASAGVARPLALR